MSELHYQDVIAINTETTKQIGPALAAEVVKAMGVEGLSLLPASKYDEYKAAADKAIVDKKALDAKRAKEVEDEAIAQAKKGASLKEHQDARDKSGN